MGILVVLFLVVVILVLAAPAVFLVGGLGSIGRDAVTERRIRKIFDTHLPGTAAKEFEKIVGPLDDDALGTLMAMSLRDASGEEMGRYAVAYWERRRVPRVYES